MSASTPAEKSEAEGQLTYALRGLLAVAENYPQLQASGQFQSLQGSLSGTEDAIQNSRRYYNAVVRDLNTKIQSFPTNIVAGMFHVQQRQFFDITDPTERENVAVKF
jgi:LemA protein